MVKSCPKAATLSCNIAGATLPIGGRADNDIKNFWYTRLKKCKREGLPVYHPPKIQQPSFTVLKSLNFISPNSPYHSLIPPISIVKDNTDGSSFYFFNPFQIQPFSTSHFQTRSISNDIPDLNPSEESLSSEKVVVDNKGKGKLPEDLPGEEELCAIKFKPTSEGGCIYAAENGHLVDSSSNSSSLIRMTAEDDLFDQEMAAPEDISLTSLLEFPEVPPHFSEWYAMPIDSSREK